MVKYMKYIVPYGVKGCFYENYTEKKTFKTYLYQRCCCIFDCYSAVIVNVRNCFVESTEAKIIKEGETAVFCTLFLGQNAYGVTEIEGGGLEHIVKQKGYGNDPLNQRSSVGWKATKVAKRLLEEYMLRIESGTEFSPTAEEN